MEDVGRTIEDEERRRVRGELWGGDIVTDSGFQGRDNLGEVRGDRRSAYRALSKRGRGATKRAFGEVDRSRRKEGRKEGGPPPVRKDEDDPATRREGNFDGRNYNDGSVCDTEERQERQTDETARC
mmetsp:Transcript_23967/g.73840  ORF Transcript_23967/g.73840 Transcript_23967/m.73840 type:complete len:126 (-) Transcript_23967:950-1327(-)